ncbi:hypothetical protein HDU93_007997 [Gonapodya sp. JEL0774]|nr:hypothetical protein HDU93_007997 [Gonapodya sp. JEL0774]
MSDDQCSNQTGSIINYAAFYYCTMNGHPGLAVILLTSWLLYIFLLFATTVSSFFVPNIQRLTKALSLSESVAGVTLAALGNGAPDIFSSVAAFSNVGTNELGIGVLLGGSLFVIMVVVGAVALLNEKPFSVPRRPFLRDIATFVGALVMLIVVLADGKITIVESTVMILYYVIYVLVVVVGHVIFRRRKALRNKLSVATHVGQTEDSDDLAWPDETSRLLEDNETDIHLTLDDDVRQFEKDNPPVLDMPDASNTSTRTENVYSTIYTLLSVLSPFAQGWRATPLYERLAGLALLPFWIPLRFTIPVVMDDDYSEPLVLQTPSTPRDEALVGDQQIGDGLTLEANDIESFENEAEDDFPGIHENLFGIPSWIPTLLLSILVAIAVFMFSKVEEPPKWYPLLALLGFLSGMAWIYMIANELVGILSTFGKILQINDALLGLTVFAIGNSFGDLITDLAMARMGLGTMAIAAAFGGPLLSRYSRTLMMRYTSTYLSGRDQI